MYSLMDKPKSKIAIISISLSGGGAERFGGALGGMLQDLGYEIHNIVINDEVDFAYSGYMYNLGIASKKRRLLPRKLNKGILLRQYLHDHKIDIIIDNRSRNFFLREWMTKWVYGNRRLFYMVH